MTNASGSDGRSLRHHVPVGAHDVGDHGGGHDHDVGGGFDGDAGDGGGE